MFMIFFNYYLKEIINSISFPDWEEQICSPARVTSFFFFNFNFFLIVCF